MSFNFMAAVTVFTDFGIQENKATISNHRSSCTVKETINRKGQDICKQLIWLLTQLSGREQPDPAIHS